MKLRKRSNSGNDQRHKGSLGRKNPENDEKLSKENDQDYSETFTDWETPKITWINGVPGCGKTTWIVQEFDNKRDCIVTATIEAAEDLKRKLANRIGAEATTRVRTMASILVNGFKEHTQPSPNRRGYDEPLWRNNNGRSAGQGQGTAAYRRHKSNPSHRQTQCLSDEL
ncbi:hypothetical protein EVAR_84151_1 [Eumeta japonica]|uniref:(+)RNA virus helicase C-terminal domain-containing protein n=1 Tax=Eumeta variegata TaxID=151549 RepID=A0A4C2A9V3_EUMVA|nr:hypothetical protein EVAR_84151_1 [Eumeta japonica]